MNKLNESQKEIIKKLLKTDLKSDSLNEKRINIRSDLKKEFENSIKNKKDYASFLARYKNIFGYGPAQTAPDLTEENFTKGKEDYKNNTWNDSNLNVWYTFLRFLKNETPISYSSDKKLLKKLKLNGDYKNLISIYEFITKEYKCTNQEAMNYISQSFNLEKANSHINENSNLEIYLKNHNFNWDLGEGIVNNSSKYENYEDLFESEYIYFGNVGYNFNRYNKSKVGDLYFITKTIGKDTSQYIAFGIIEDKFQKQDDYNDTYKINWIDKDQNITFKGEFNPIKLDRENNFIISKKISNVLIPNKEKEDFNLDSNNILSKKNQIILYGPPGTGKTFNINNIIQNFLNDELDLLKKADKINIKNQNFKFITFHQSFSYEEFIEGIKATSENGNIIYNIEDGVFKKTCIQALYDCLDLNESKELNFEELYNELINKIKNNEISFQTKSNQKLNVDKVTSNENIHIKHGNSLVKHIVSKNRIKKLFDNVENLDELESIQNIHSWTTEIIGGSNVSAYYGVLSELLKLKNQYSETYEILENNEENYSTISKIVKNKLESDELIFKNKKLQKPYFFVIDEINRGNISKIFGELITLLEKNKRLGNEDELIVELPYSKEKFGIPPNVYLIGTMNTSDKSIASLDIALRRRFGFIEMLPSSDLISNDIEGFNLRSLFENLNGRIEFLLDKDHLIGHSFFCKVTSKAEIGDIFVSEILPLLEEYFYGDIEKLRLVLGDDFFEKRKTDEIRKLFGNNSNLDLEDDLFKLKDFKTNNEDIIPYLEKIINLETQDNKDEE